ncbi:chromatin assembly factor 1 subunit A-domain-containing protein [Melampsora americana]|nr:chromatin assembly factor 1 subunit A-domain-containing protein [Melampsora americana]
MSTFIPQSTSTSSPSSSSSSLSSIELQNQPSSPKKIKLPNQSINHKSLIKFDKLKATFSINQIQLDLSDLSLSIKKDLISFTEHLQSRDQLLTEFNPHQLNLISSLVHESQKPISQLSKYLHSKLLPQSILDDDDDESCKKFDPLPLSLLESAVTQVAKWVNYGLEKPSGIDWLPDELLQNRFEIWRWESNDRQTIIPIELREKYEKRWEERQLIKSQIIDYLSNLNQTEQEALIKKLQGPQKRKPKLINQPNSSNHPENLQSTDPINPISPDKKDTIKLTSEKELARIARDQKKREKEEAKQAEEQAKKKMGNLMSGWISKANHPNHDAQSSPSTSTFDKKQTSTTSSAMDSQTRFFQPSQPLIGGSSSSKSNLSDFQRVFKPFNVKANVDVAPPNRFQRVQENNEIIHIPHLTLQRCLEDFITSIAPEYKPIPSQIKSNQLIPTREIVNGLAENEMSGSIEGTRKFRRMLKNRSLVPLKHLQFHEDVRPGYIGTWSKTSRLVKPRKPFGKDSCLLDYDYDSEADWVEDDLEGEDLEGSDLGKNGDESEGETGLDESDEDGWLVGDDDEIELELNDMEDQVMEELEAIGKTSNTVGVKRRKIVGPLVPVVKGPIWEKRLGDVDVPMFEPFRIQFINDARIGLNPFTHITKPQTIKKPSKKPKSMNPNPSHQPTKTPLAPSMNLNQIQPPPPLSPSTTTTTTTTTTLKSQTQKPIKIFPNEHLTKLKSIIQGNSKSKPLLIEEIRLSFLNELKLSKVLIEKKLNEIAIKVSGVWKIKVNEVERIEESEKD